MDEDHLPPKSSWLMADLQPLALSVALHAPFVIRSLPIFRNAKLRF